MILYLDIRDVIVDVVVFATAGSTDSDRFDTLGGEISALNQTETLVPVQLVGFEDSLESTEISNYYLSFFSHGGGNMQLR